jgi:predicted ferric reductase
MHGIHPAALVALYLALALTPLALAAASGARENEVLAELGVGLALVAYATMLLQFISSGRFEALSGRVGIDRTMRFHQLAARSAAVMILLHPLVPHLSGDAAGLAALPAIMCAMFTAPHLLSGVVAWILVLALVSLAIFRHHLPVRYETWRAGHALGAVTVAGLGAHHTLTVGTYSETVALFWFWCVLLALAVAAIGHVYFLRPRLNARWGYVLTANREVAPGIRELALEPVSGRGMRFRAGQIAWLNLRSLPLFDHPFSISSAPAELPRVRFTAKARGDFTRALERVPAGTRVLLDAPHGNFGLEAARGRAVCLIAGGIGISPIIGVLRHLHEARDKRPVSLLYGARNPGQLVYAQEILALPRRLALRVELSVDEPGDGWRGRTGPFDLDAVRAALDGVPAGGWACLVCGPTPMMLAMERHLLAVGVPAGQIVYERFEYD